MYSSKISIYKNGEVEIRKYDGIIHSQKNRKFNNCVVDELKTTISENDKNSKSKHNKNDAKVISKKSLDRSRKNIINTVKNNEDKFNSFVTLTFKENIKDVDEAFDIFRKYIRKVRKHLDKKGLDLYYLCVPEFQQRGAIHFHMIWSVSVDTLVIPKQPKKTVCSHGKLIDIEYYDLTYWKYGFSTAYKIEKINEKFSIALYMIKYLYKSFNDEDNKRLYSRQKVLKSQNFCKTKEYKLLHNKEVDKVMEILENYVVEKMRYNSQDNKFISFEQFSYKTDDNQINTVENYLDNYMKTILSENRKE